MIPLVLYWFYIISLSTQYIQNKSRCKDAETGTPRTANTAS